MGKLLILLVFATGLLLTAMRLNYQNVTLYQTFDSTYISRYYLIEDGDTLQIFAADSIDEHGNVYALPIN